MRWNSIKFFDQTQYPEHLLCLFGLKRIKKFFDWTFTIFGPVKDDFSTHALRLTCKLTIVNHLLLLLLAFSFELYAFRLRLALPVEAKRRSRPSGSKMPQRGAQLNVFDFLFNRGGMFTPRAPLNRIHPVKFTPVIAKRISLGPSALCAMPLPSASSPALRDAPQVGRRQTLLKRSGRGLRPRNFLPYFLPNNSVLLFMIF